jgi:hypothetical protein
MPGRVQHACVLLPPTGLKKHGIAAVLLDTPVLDFKRARHSSVSAWVSASALERN